MQRALKPVAIATATFLIKLSDCICAMETPMFLPRFTGL